MSNLFNNAKNETVLSSDYISEGRGIPIISAVDLIIPRQVLMIVIRATLSFSGVSLSFGVFT